jgi:hypothetical protein
MNKKIIDNFLPEKDFLEIKNTLIDDGMFPWFVNIGTTVENKPSSLYDFQFFHLFYYQYKINSDFYSLIEPIIEKINPTSILRIKANVLTKTEEKIVFDFHKDVPIKCKTAVYYINTNNGGTIFKNGDFIESKENRLLIFDSQEEHASVSCTDNFFRCILNINYIDYEEYNV